MDISRIKVLREALEAEAIDTQELLEIEAAFNKIPESELPEPRENALAGNMLDELEQRVTPAERAIYVYVLENYGESEANDPSWAISSLANHLNKEFNL